MLRSRTTWLALAGVVAIALLAFFVVNGATEGLDDAIIRFVRQPALDAPLAPLAVITELGSTWAVTLIALIVLAWLALRGNPRWGIASGLVIGVASLANTAFKRWIERARPEVLDPLIVEHGFSFPSGHAMLGMTAWGIVAVVVARSDLPRVARRGIVAGLAVLIALIGVSRIYLGVHYPSDVLAGWVAGAVIVVLYAEATRPLARPRLAPDVSAEPATRGVGAADEDRAAPRSDPPVRR